VLQLLALWGTIFTRLPVSDELWLNLDDVARSGGAFLGGIAGCDAARG